MFADAISAANVKKVFGFSRSRTPYVFNFSYQTKISSSGDRQAAAVGVQDQCCCIQPATTEGAVLAMITKMKAKSHTKYFSVRIDEHLDNNMNGSFDEIKVTINGEDKRYGYEDMVEFESEIEK
jgi:hypothetical protein